VNGGNGNKGSNYSGNGSTCINNSINTGGTGAGTTTREFGESNGKLYAGGGNGAGVFYAVYGDGVIYPHTITNTSNAGGGSSFGDGTANTGGGGGGGFCWENDNGKVIGSKNAGSGGSGIVVIRNHN
jgi:hypothetical protein